MDSHRTAYVQILIALAILYSNVGAESLADNTSPLAQASNLSHFPRLGIWVNPEMSIDKIDSGSASERAGLKVGDRIASIEGRPITQLNGHDRIHLLTGETGTVSHLVIVRGKNPYSAAITRSDLPTQHSPGIGPIQTPMNATVAQPAQLDRDLIEIETRTARTEETYQQILKGLRLLSPDVKRAFVDYGTKIVITPRFSATDNAEGGCYFSPRTKQVVMHEPTDPDMRRLPITTLHELGHAYDWMCGRISTNSDFQQCYDDDLGRANLTPEMTRSLEHFLQPGQKGKTECFASLFARRYYKEPDKRLQYLETSFPTALKFVQNLKP
jgi:hypothetical protein